MNQSQRRLLYFLRLFWTPFLFSQIQRQNSGMKQTEKEDTEGILHCRVTRPLFIVMCKMACVRLG